MLNEIRAIRSRAQANRDLLPSHPRYIHQYRRDMGRGLIAAAFSIALTMSIGNYAVHKEERSQKRAEEACLAIRCRENLIQLDVQMGVDPATDNRIGSAIPYNDVKEAIDQTNYFDDMLPIAGGSVLALATNVLAGLYLAKPYLNHRKRLLALNTKKRKT